jgi:hypothetical protein
VGVAEVDQYLGPEPDRTEVRVHRGRPLVAADRVFVLAEQLPHVAEAIPGGRGDHRVIDPVGDGQGLLAVDEARSGVAEPGFEPADGIERGSEPRPLPEDFEQFARLLSVAERSFAVIHAMQEAGEVQVGTGLAIDVLQLGELLKGSLQVSPGIVISSQHREGAAQPALGLGLGFPVPGLLRGRHRDRAGSGQILPAGGLVQYAG